MQWLTEIHWHGWNALAVRLVFVASLFATAGWFLVSWKFGDTLFSQMVAFGIGGLAMILCDLIYRSRQRDTGMLLRFVSPLAGGTIVLFPVWTLGIGTIAVATSIYLSETPR
jgi:hypothetical protein